MLTNIVERKRRERLPQDSGEWRPIPLEFKKLPSQNHRRDKQAFGAAILNIILQSIFGALAVWFMFESVSVRHLDWLPVMAFGIGLVTSACTAGVIAHQHRFTVRHTMAVIMQGQLYWGTLLFIPCYGWAVFCFLSIPCAFGALFGAAIGARCGQPQGAWT